MLNAILSIRPEQKKHPKRIRSAHLASTSASRRCRIWDFACGFSSSSPMASRSAFIVLSVEGKYPYLVHNNEPAYLCIILIEIDISHGPENSVPLPDANAAIFVLSPERAPCVGKERCRDKRYWCVMRHTTGLLCRTRKAAEILCGLTRESRNVLSPLDAHDASDGARRIYVERSFIPGEQSYIPTQKSVFRSCFWILKIVRRITM